MLVPGLILIISFLPFLHNKNCGRHRDSNPDRWNKCRSPDHHQGPGDLDIMSRAIESLSNSAQANLGNA